MREKTRRARRPADRVPSARRVRRPAGRADRAGRKAEAVAVPAREVPPCKSTRGRRAARLRPTQERDVVLGRIFQFLNDSPVTPFGIGAAQVTPAWAATVAAAILDDQLTRGTEARGLARFLSSWLNVRADSDAGLPAARTWARKLLDPNATLTTLFAGPTGDPHRKGIFTDQQVLAARGDISERGYWFFTHLFCGDPLVHPPGIPAGQPPKPGSTRRQARETEVASPLCMACHKAIDPAGFSLEHFDALGNYREMDNGQAVDSAGTVTLPTPMLTFTSIDDLAPQLATSCLVARCFSRSVMIDAYAVPPATATLPFNDQEVDQVATAFANSNFAIRELVKAIVSSPSFLR